MNIYQLEVIVGGWLLNSWNTSSSGKRKKLLLSVCNMEEAENQDKKPLSDPND
jgi:hypothetical protein